LDFVFFCLVCSGVWLDENHANLCDREICVVFGREFCVFGRFVTMSPDRLESHQSQLPITNRCRISRIRDDSSKSGDLCGFGEICVGSAGDLCVVYKSIDSTLVYTVHQRGTRDTTQIDLRNAKKSFCVFTTFLCVARVFRRQSTRST
jgi:hypothetical protein